MAVKTKKFAVSALVISLVVFLWALLAPCGCGGKNDGQLVSTGPLPEYSASSEPEPAESDVPTSQPVPPPQPETTDEAEVTRTAVAFARENNPSLPELMVLDVKISGDWARVDLQPVDKSTDAASALLKKTQGVWEVIDFGYIIPDDYPEAPREIFE